MIFGMLLGLFLCGILNGILYELLGRAEADTIFSSNGLAVAVGLGSLMGILYGSVWSVAKTKTARKLTGSIFGSLIGLLVSLALYLLLRDIVNFRGPNLFIGFFVCFCFVLMGLILGTFIGFIFEAMWSFISHQLALRD
ncbi:MAG: hypothetical protein HC806_10015 [Anaerolineae bacterium]|nr:hypothetical protein [Anaerolineae bacterium]